MNPEKALDEVLNRGLQFLTFEDDRYPYLLKNISDPPVVLYYKGDLDSVNFDEQLGVVGSRKASTNSKDVLTKIITELRGTDICIVSGLASGIDTTAHQAALSNNLKTIGVIASGFDFVYPTANKDLYKKIENGGGLILLNISRLFSRCNSDSLNGIELSPDFHAGLVVAEAALKSGALITANLCLEQGRELMCIPGLDAGCGTRT